MVFDMTAVTLNSGVIAFTLKSYGVCESGYRKMDALRGVLGCGRATLMVDGMRRRM
jgi:hypothetical protein